MHSTKNKKQENLTRQALASKISEAADLDHKASVELVNQVVLVITEALSRGEDVLISGFGKFVRLDKKSREGRNPLNGAPVTIEARKVVKLRASEQLKGALVAAALNER